MSQTILFITAAAAAENWSPADGRADTLAAAENWSPADGRADTLAAAAENGSYAHGTRP